MNQYNGLRPINDDGPARIRDTDINNVYGAFQNLKAQDPNREKREMLLEAFCRYPYARVEDKCLVDGYSANFGEFHYKINSKIQTAVDFLTERPTAFTIKTNYRDPKLDPETAEYHSTRESELITLAFQKFFITRWKKWSYNLQMDAFSWNMYGKAFEYWPDPASPYSRPINPKDVFPDANASMYPEDWDTVYIRLQLYAWELWRMAQSDKLDRWDKESLIYCLKYALKQNDWEEQVILQGFGNWQLDWQLQNQQLSVVVMLVREYEPNGDGKQISKYIFSEQWPNATGQNNQKEKGFLFRQPFAYKSIGNALCMLADQVGTGYYYNNPSFGELIYVSTYEYERLMNRIMQAIDLNMMLILESNDANAGDKVRNNTLQDAIIMAPGTSPSQVRIQLPVGDAAQIMGKVQADLARGIQSYEIGTPNPAGGSTPITAQQSRQDASQALRAESMYLKWMNHSYGDYGDELYRRFTTDVSGETEKDLKAFRKWLEDRGVKEECWKHENVEIVSTGMQGAGNPQQRFDAAVAVMDILARVPATEGERKAQRDALAALVGADKVDEYLVAQKQFATEQDRVISMENASLNTEPETPVRPDDNHILHFQGHMMSAAKDVQSAAAFLQEPANDIDKGIDLNETSQKLLSAQNKAAHASIHLQLIARDQRHANLVRQFQGDIAELSRQADKIESVANQMAQAREAKLAELNGTDPEIQKQQALAQIEIQTAQAMADIKVGDALTKAQVQEDLAKKRSNAESEMEIEKAATDIAIKSETEAQKLRAQKAQDEIKLNSLKKTQRAKSSAKGSAQ